MKSTPLLALFAAAFYFVDPANAAIKTQIIDYKDGNVALQGFLAYDDAIATPTPGVLVVHEWWGLSDYSRARAKQLAGLGYTAFALDMYGNGVKAETPEAAGKLAGQFYENRDLMRSRAAAGLNVLKTQKNVDPKRIAAIGYCFGGSTVLELSRGGADLAAVVSFHGGLDFPDPSPTKNIKAKILICAGADDPMVPIDKLHAFVAQLKDARIDYEVNLYGGAVHGFSNPEADKHGMPGLAYNEKADKRSWEAMRYLFQETFGK